jgi:hypothetical protein
MFVKFFNTNNPLILILIFVIGILFWINVFISPFAIPDSSDIFPLYNLTCFILKGQNHLNEVLAFLLVFTEGLLINLIINRNKLFSSSTYLPAMLFILLMSAVKHLQILTPSLIAILFVILAIKQMFDIYDKEKAYSQIFKIGFFISVASLFYLPSLFLVVLVFISFIIFKIFKWREWFIFLIGLITPYLYIAVYWFWNDKLIESVSEYSNYFNTIGFGIHKFNTGIYVIMTISGILTLLSISKILNEMREKLIKIRLSFYVIIWFLIITLFIIFFGNIKQAYFFQFIFIPLSILLSNYIQHIRKDYLRDIIFAVSLLIVIISRFVF